MSQTDKIPAKYIDKVVKAYHGTSIEKAETIIETNTILPSTNDHDWLGHGTYFWEDSRIRAWKWAHDRNPNNPAVVITEVHLGCCIDLINSAWNEVILSTYEILAKEYEAKDKTLPKNKPNGENKLDCLIMNHITDNLYYVDTIRGAYLEGKPLFPHSLFFNLSHVQLVVKNKKKITTNYVLDGMR